MSIYNTFLPILVFASLFKEGNTLENVEFNCDYNLVRADIDNQIQNALEALDIYPQEQVRLALFALCAYVDETILTSNWLYRNSWAKETLQKVYCFTTRAGVLFYRNLEELLPQPPPPQEGAEFLQKVEVKKELWIQNYLSQETEISESKRKNSRAHSLHDEVLLLYATCLSLGFMGQYYTHEERSHLDARLLQRLSDILEADIYANEFSLLPSVCHTSKVKQFYQKLSKKIIIREDKKSRHQDKNSQLIFIGETVAENSALYKAWEENLKHMGNDKKKSSKVLILLLPAEKLLNNKRAELERYAQAVIEKAKEFVDFSFFILVTEMDRVFGMSALAHLFSNQERQQWLGLLNSECLSMTDFTDKVLSYTEHRLKNISLVLTACNLLEYKQNTAQLSKAVLIKEEFSLIENSLRLFVQNILPHTVMLDGVFFVGAGEKGKVKSNVLQKFETFKAVEWQL